MLSIANGINNIFNLYFYILIFRIFLTWIPSIQWDNQPWRTLREVSDIYLNLFRKFIPPIGGLDISPIVALLVLDIARRLIIYLLLTFL